MKSSGLTHSSDVGVVRMLVGVHMHTHTHTLDAIVRRHIRHAREERVYGTACERAVCRFDQDAYHYGIIILDSRTARPNVNTDLAWLWTLASVRRSYDAFRRNRMECAY